MADLNFLHLSCKPPELLQCFKPKLFFQRHTFHLKVHLDWEKCHCQRRLEGLLPCLSALVSWEHPASCTSRAHPSSTPWWRKAYRQSKASQGHLSSARGDGQIDKRVKNTFGLQQFTSHSADAFSLKRPGTRRKCLLKEKNPQSPDGWEYWGTLIKMDQDGFGWQVLAAFTCGMNQMSATRREFQIPWIQTHCPQCMQKSRWYWGYWSCLCFPSTLFYIKSRLADISVYHPVPFILWNSYRQNRVGVGFFPSISLSAFATTCIE